MYHLCGPKSNIFGGRPERKPSVDTPLFHLVQTVLVKTWFVLLVRPQKQHFRRTSRTKTECGHPLVLSTARFGEETLGENHNTAQNVDMWTVFSFIITKRRCPHDVAGPGGGEPVPACWLLKCPRPSGGALAQSQTGVLLQLVHIRLTLGGALSVSSRFVVRYGYMLCI